MIEISPESADWNSHDEERWNAFLKTNTGSKLIPKVLESTPALLSGGDINSILVRSGEVRGFQIFVNALLALTHAPELPTTEPTAYPSLEDDTKWEGPAINEKSRSA